MSNGVALAPGMRVLCRDAEWLVTRIDPSDYTHTHHAVHCVGADDLVRGHEAIFITPLRYQHAEVTNACPTPLQVSNPMTVNGKRGAMRSG